MKEKEKFKMLKESSSLIFGDYGKFLYEQWENHNRKIFGGKLMVGGIQCGLTPHGKNLGYYSPQYNTITMHWSLVPNGGKYFSTKGGKDKPFGLHPSKALASDVLLHEMIHQCLHQTKKYKNGDDPHMCQAWIDELNRISPLIGLRDYFFTLYKRSKEKISRKNYYTPINETPKRLKTAPREAIITFPIPLRSYVSTN